MLEKIILLCLAMSIMALALVGLGWLSDHTNILEDENTIDKINEFIFGKE